MLAVGTTRRAAERRMQQSPDPLDGPNALASVIISNYNYARFLPGAIGSVLRQTHPRVEVVVVDDGSTDDSRAIIAGYGDRVVPIYKQNGGLASSINAGVVASRGEVICFLDADDLFHPEKVARVVRAFRASPDAALVYHQLQGVDPRDARIGRPWPRAVWRGDIRARVERSGGWWPHPTTSALSFRRSFAERLFPIPPPNRETYPDTFLAGPAAFVGPVIGLRAPLAHFRLHGDNMSYWGRQAAGDDPDQAREKLRRNVEQYADELRRLERTLAGHLGISASLSLDDHLPYQRYRRALGEGMSLARVVALAARCPALPPSMRLVEAANVVLDRW